MRLSEYPTDRKSFDAFLETPTLMMSGITAILSCGGQTKPKNSNSPPVKVSCARSTKILKLY